MAAILDPLSATLPSRLAYPGIPAAPRSPMVGVGPVSFIWWPSDAGGSRVGGGKRCGIVASRGHSREMIALYPTGLPYYVTVYFQFTTKG